MYLEEKENHDHEEPNDSMYVDRFARMHPHFLYDIEKTQILSVNRKNESTSQNSKSGFIPGHTGHQRIHGMFCFVQIAGANKNLKQVFFA